MLRDMLLNDCRDNGSVRESQQTSIYISAPPPPQPMPTGAKFLSNLDVNSYLINFVLLDNDWRYCHWDTC